MIREALAGALLLAAGPASANCSTFVLKDDLPDCVRELASKVFILQAQLQAERSRINLYSTIACNLALAANKASPSADAAETAEAACAETKDRIAAMKKRTTPAGPQPPSK